MIIAIAIGASIATFVGGMIALRFKDRLHLILGFTAGAVVAVAFFDLLPEALELGSNYYSNSYIVGFVALGFLIYLILDRTLFLHSHVHEEGSSFAEATEDKHDHELTHHESKYVNRGRLGASSLSVHSFLDGVAIGLAFQVSSVVGGVVALAVLAHDFSDGINTVNLILKNAGKAKNALKWLVIDSLAPVFGVVSTLFFTLKENVLALILALFAGFFLYIGATDLIPESHHAHPKFLTTLMTLVGAGLLFFVIHFANA